MADPTKSVKIKIGMSGAYSPANPLLTRDSDRRTRIIEVIDVPAEAAMAQVLARLGRVVILPWSSWMTVRWDDLVQGRILRADPPSLSDRADVGRASIRDVLRETRMARGMTQSQLAEAAGIRQATISEYESGGECMASTVEAVMRVLGLVIAASGDDEPRRGTSMGT